MSNNNPYDLIAVGMLAELHRAVSKEESPAEEAAAPQPSKLLALPRRLVEALLGPGDISHTPTTPLAECE
jgi:hypothetical protein